MHLLYICNSNLSWMESELGDDPSPCPPPKPPGPCWGRVNGVRCALSACNYLVTKRKGIQHGPPNICCLPVLHWSDQARIASQSRSSHTPHPQQNINKQADEAEWPSVRMPLRRLFQGGCLYMLKDARMYTITNTPLYSFPHSTI